jgi:aromatic ring-opening dioxygenase catalytic subunit (LigB family)
MMVREMESPKVFNDYLYHFPTFTYSLVYRSASNPDLLRETA